MGKFPIKSQRLMIRVPEPLPVLAVKTVIELQMQFAALSAQIGITFQPNFIHIRKLNRSFGNERLNVSMVDFVLKWLWTKRNSHGVHTVSALHRCVPDTAGIGRKPSTVPIFH